MSGLGQSRDAKIKGLGIGAGDYLVKAGRRAARQIARIQASRAPLEGHSQIDDPHREAGREPRQSDVSSDDSRCI